MSPTTVAVSKFQNRNRDRYMKRLVLPGEHEPRIVRALLVFAAVVSLLCMLDAVLR